MADDMRVINGQVFQVRRVIETWGVPVRLPWCLFRGWDRLGYFRLKREAWAAAEVHAMGEDSEATRRAREVEREQSMEGARILDQIRKWNGKRTY